MNRAKAVVVLFVTLLCGLIPWTRAADADTARIEWVVYNGPFLRFEYQKGWGVMYKYKALPPHGKRYWFVDPPGGEKTTLSGSIVINEDTAGKEKRPLAKKFAEIKWNSGYALQGATTTIKPKGGECLVYQVEDNGLNCHLSGIDVDNPPKEPPDCMTATAYAACYGRNGHYFEFLCELSRYTWPGKPGKEAKEHRRIFQHLLDTLQFK